MRDARQEFVDYYRVLGVSPDSSHREIREAYRREAMRWHPDRNASADAAGRMRLVNEAWGVLGDWNRRRVYDRELIGESGSRRRPGDGSGRTDSEYPPFTQPSSTDRRSARGLAPAPISQGNAEQMWANAMWRMAAASIGLPITGVALTYLTTNVFLGYEAALLALRYVSLITGLLWVGLLVSLCRQSRNEGENALHRLMGRRVVDPWEIQTLVDSGARPSTRDSTGATPLTIAAKAGASAEVLDRLATPVAVERSRSALYWLISNGTGSTTELSQIVTLINAGALERRPRNPWKWLVRQARILRLADKDLHERWDRYRGLELHALLSRRNVQPDVVATLVQAGASLTAKDRYGRTPIEIALEMRHPRAIVELLAP